MSNLTISGDDYPFIINDELKATMVNVLDGFPIEFYRLNIMKTSVGYTPWHWHNEFEFIIVNKGTFDLYLPNAHYILHENEGYFVNSKVLHMLKAQNKEYAETTGFAFHPNLIAEENSLIFKKYIQPLLMNSSVPYFIIQNEKWHIALKQNIRKIIGYVDCPIPFSEVIIRNLISDLICTVIQHQNDIPTVPLKKRDITQFRLNTMCEFIQKEYTDALTLDKIAHSALISKSEAIRCFKHILDLTPYQYLLNYRITKAQYYLTYTDEPIIEIAIKCGFNNGSYFAKLFQKHVGQTPKDYRKKTNP